MVLLRSAASRFARPAISALNSSFRAPRATPLFRQAGAARTLTATSNRQGKVLLVLYDAGQHAQDEPRLLGCTENELGIRKWVESQGHELVTTSDKEGPNSAFEKHLVDAEVIITTP